jgi:hypothetical protein
MEEKISRHRQRGETKSVGGLRTIITHAASSSSRCVMRKLENGKIFRTEVVRRRGEDDDDDDEEEEEEEFQHQILFSCTAVSIC